MPDSKEHEGLDAYLLKRYTVLKLLGRGAYGIVWKVVDKESGRTMALKRCFDAFQNNTDAQRTFREIVFLQELNGHENIVRLMNVLKAESHMDLYVLFDFMETDLQHVISADMLTTIHVEYVTYQVLKALKYVHSAGVLHRDLKPSNVLLNANCHVRLCDFGLARTSTPALGSTTKETGPGPALFTDYVATRWYRAPELLLGATLYSEGVDMWSVGCIVGEMVSKKPILKGKSTMDQLEKIIELTGRPSEADLRPISSTSQYARTMIDSLGKVRQVPSSGVLFLLRAPEAAKVLTLSLLRFNPEKRPTAETCLEDPFVEKFHLQEAEPTCDKVIRMPIADASKLKAADYRSHIYAMISQRRKMAMEERRAERQQKRSSSFASLGECDAPLHCWSHEGGAAPPPGTPR
uniref:Mitogen-activated protein kinase n=1 Tax=Alexandrium monilatum TaxID=311494 RepID=A0A7S4UCQ5_9DINO